MASETIRRSHSDLFFFTKQCESEVKENRKIYLANSNNVQILSQNDYLLYGFICDKENSECLVYMNNHLDDASCLYGSHSIFEIN